jgi:putative transcriptional regulator
MTTKSKRDIGAEILEGMQDMQAHQHGKLRLRTHRLRSLNGKDAKRIRKKLGFSQSVFAALLGVSLRTLQEWEQMRREPRGPAQALLRVADRHPEALL